jgi:hypothetical protein
MNFHIAMVWSDDKFKQAYSKEMIHNNGSQNVRKTSLFLKMLAAATNFGKKRATWKAEKFEFLNLQLQPMCFHSQTELKLMGVKWRRVLLVKISISNNVTV